MAAVQTAIEVKSPSMEIQYIGEHLLPGRVGHVALVTGFASSLMAVVSWFFATQRRHLPEGHTWRRMGRVAFHVHGLSVLTVIGTLFYLMINQYYEYHYVWAHVSEELPMQYIASAFWEGQEGSFLLWMFWHVVLGWILLWRFARVSAAEAPFWEGPVMAVLALVQAFIFTMILGVYLPGTEVKVGSNPFVLLRDVMDAPIFAKADYLELIKGNGLNPLLQNYWMTVHPPVLFLGFASVAVPFAFAVAGLWLDQHKKWLRQVLPWAAFSGFALGMGILMGGAWAYEALSFGGYWAWDPVENMSLVPWLVLVAGLHTNVVARATGHSLRSTYLFYLLAFVLVVYSTFLTRSGILGDSSVHAFTEMGLETQLISFIIAMGALGLGLFAWKYRRIPTPAEEEAFASREFWMFIGSLVLFFSAAMITAATSLPVYNKIRQLFDPAFVGLTITEPVPFYNRYQLWIAVFTGLLSGLAQFLRYREHRFEAWRTRFFKHMLLASLLAIGLTLVNALWIHLFAWQYVLLCFAASFAITSNLDYLFAFLGARLKQGASAIAHMGFGIMVVGILASGLNKHHISRNPFAMRGLVEGATEEDLARNVVLIKNSPLLLPESGYEAEYLGDTIVGYKRTFFVEFRRRDAEGRIAEKFLLTPNILYDKNFEKVAASNPSTRRYWNKDIFTHIAWLPAPEISIEEKKAAEDSLEYEPYAARIGDTVYTSKAYAIVKKLVEQPYHRDYHPQAGDYALGLQIEFRELDQDTAYRVTPVVVLRGNLMYQYPAEINELGIKVRLTDAFLEAALTSDDRLEWQRFEFRQGDEKVWNGLRLRFDGFNKDPAHPAYHPLEGDIAVGARISVSAQGQQYQAEPMYLIRDLQPLNLKDQIHELGLHLRFTGLDPEAETIEIYVAREPALHQKTWPFEIAENYRRTDYIALEAIVFPGINLFWLGSLIMLLGLLLSAFYRATQR